MEQRLSFVTLAVTDLGRTREFYLDGLGWEAELDVPGEVVMVAVGERLVLSLWDRAAFEAEVGEPAQSGPGVVPVTLAHNVAHPREVDAVLERARAAGAAVGEAVERDWGGYTAAPRWREDGEGWAEEDDLSSFGGDDTRIGAMDDDRPDPEDFFSFDDIDEPRAARSVFDAGFVLGMNLSQYTSRAQSQMGDKVGNLNWSVTNDPATKPIIRSIIGRIT